MAEYGSILQFELYTTLNTVANLLDELLYAGLTLTPPSETICTQTQLCT